MHVYLPYHLVMGVISVLLGLAVLVSALCRIFTRAFTNTFTSWFQMYMGLWLPPRGLYDCSKAFEPPHRESHLTSALGTLAALVLFAYLIAAGIAWLLHRRQAAAQSALRAKSDLEQRAARGDRGKFEQAMAKVGGGLPDEQDRLPG